MRNDLKNCDVLLVCTDNDRGFNYKGKWYSPLLDSINEDLIAKGFNTVSISRYISKYNDNNIYGNYLNINLYLRLHYIIYYFFKFLYMTFKRSRLDYFESKIYMWLRILEKIKPKKIIGIQPPAELCIAAKLLNIWIADLQHGVMHNESYYGLEYRKPYSQLGWPDCILCWDRESANKLKVYDDKYFKTIIIGNPWFKRFINITKDDELAIQYVNRYDIKLSNGKNILITLQHNIEGYKDMKKNIEEIDFGLSLGIIKQCIEANNEYNWLLRVHPIIFNKFDKKEIQSYLVSQIGEPINYEWELSSSLPLPVILKFTDLHITLESTVAIEASWFGIKSALLTKNKDNILYFKKLIDDGFVDVVSNNPTKIGEWVTKNIDSKISIKKESFTHNYEDIQDIINL